jgi:hypothetical protein
MTKPEFTWQFNLGHLLQVGATLVAVAVGWSVLDTRSQSNATAIAAIHVQLRDSENRLRVVEIQVTRADERYNAILDMLSRIDTRLERIEQVR